MRLFASFTLIAAMSLADGAFAQALTAKPEPAKAVKNPGAAPAGTYSLDPNHAAVVVRVLHGGGFSFSVFRMGAVSGVLSWDPAKLDDSEVSVNVETKSLTTTVAGLGAQLSGPDFLNAARFPDATFRSTAVKRTGPTTGEVTGDFTLHGVTRPLTLDVEMVGAGPALRGPAIGFHGRGQFHRSDFGVGPVSPMIGDEVELVIDVEFDLTP
jgi:polyisoprenoid-binding protein YceI